MVLNLRLIDLNRLYEKLGYFHRRKNDINSIHYAALCLLYIPVVPGGQVCQRTADLQLGCYNLMVFGSHQFQRIPILFLWHDTATDTETLVKLNKRKWLSGKQEAISGKLVQRSHHLR